MNFVLNNSCVTTFHLSYRSVMVNHISFVFLEIPTFMIMKWQLLLYRIITMMINV